MTYLLAKEKALKRNQFFPQSLWFFVTGSPRKLNRWREGRREGKREREMMGRYSDRGGKYTIFHLYVFKTKK